MLDSGRFQEFAKNTILAWYRRLIARKFDGSQHRSYPGRRRVDAAVEALIVRMTQENSTWGTIGSLEPWQSRPLRLRPDDCEHPEATRYRPGAEAQPNHDLEGLHFGSHGSPGWHRFPHG